VTVAEEPSLTGPLLVMPVAVGGRLLTVTVVWKVLLTPPSSS